MDLMEFLSKSIGVLERQSYDKVHFQMLVSMENLVLFGAKGQLISECLFDFLNFPKNHQKI